MGSFHQGHRIWDGPPSALPGANLLKRLPNISKIKVPLTPSKNLFAQLFKSGPPELLIINSSYDLNGSPSPILHAIPLVISWPKELWKREEDHVETS
jgi:hypothetical protein